MAVLELSYDLMLNLPERVAVGNLSSTVLTAESKYPLVPLFPYNFFLTNTDASNKVFAYLKLYSGSVPTLEDLTSYTSRNSDALITFEIRETEVFNERSVFNTNPIVINTNFVSASGTGTATWFRLYSYHDVNLIHQIIGTVGLPQDNPDLELGDVTLTAGFPYKISNFRILFPSSFTY